MGLTGAHDCELLWTGMVVNTLTAVTPHMFGWMKEMLGVLRLACGVLNAEVRFVPCRLKIDCDLWIFSPLLSVVIRVLFLE